MTEPIVVIKDVRKVYDNGTEALKSISLEVNQGEIFGLIGVNGAGKTTLIRILTTMLRATDGYARVCGLDPAVEPEEVRALIGVLPQNAGFYEEFTISENLSFIGEMQGMEKLEIQERIEYVANLLEIKDRLNTRINQLSGGLKQRTMIARTLMGNPKILFLDEPTTGLDVIVARRVRQIIKILSQTMTIFIATHNMHEAHLLCTRVAIIKDGKILLVDTPENILNKHKVDTDDFEDVIANILGIDDQALNELEAP